MRKWVFTIAFCAMFVQGCTTTALVGQAIRSNIKDIEFNITNGYNIKEFADSKVAISTNVGDSSSPGMAALVVRSNKTFTNKHYPS